VTNDSIASAAQLACLLEASAPKPGNVSPGRHFLDATYEDFLASAAAIGPTFMADLPLGATIHAAIRATSQWTRSNTNLGIVLLLAPLTRAARSPGPLRHALHDVLGAATVEDAREVYAAIRLARPGGMGQVEEQDLGAEPTVTLTEAMRLATARDTIAMEYTTDFAVTFEIGYPAVVAARARGASWLDATVETYLELLSSLPDSLIERKYGNDIARYVSRRARRVAAARGAELMAELDSELREHGWNPGTTADLTAASLYVALLSGLWHPSR
jgi:triphosphoribosyl-dephospho-CoA synthase